MDFDRMRKLAGFEPAVLTEGPINNAMARGSMNDYQSPAKLYGLYVGLRGSGELHIQFTGDRADCLSQWHDDLKRDYKRGEAVARVVPIHDNAPNVIAESFECEDSEEIVMEAEAVEGDSGASFEDVARYLGVDTQRVRELVSNGALTLVPSTMVSKASVVALNDKWDADSKHGWPQGQWGKGGSPAEPRAMQESAKAPATENADKTPALDATEEKKVATVKVPADVTAAINSRIAELKKAIAEYNDKGYDDGGVKPNAIEALEQIAADLKLEDGLTKANIFYGTLMSPITDLFPPKVVKFLHTAPAKKVTESTFEQGNVHKSDEFFDKGVSLMDDGWAVEIVWPDGYFGFEAVVTDNSGKKVYDITFQELSNFVREMGIAPRTVIGGSRNTQASLIGYAYSVVNDIVLPFSSDENPSEKQEMHSKWIGMDGKETHKPDPKYAPSTRRQ